MTYTMLDAALRTAEVLGPVFPCTPGAKVPLYPNPHPRGSDARRTCRGGCGQWGHGVLDATTDPDVITEWWTRCPHANIGHATGAPGVDVVDVDTKHGANGRESYVRLRDAGLLRGAFAVVTTPSGGWHLYYEGTGQGNSVRARHGIDFRGVGGYVLVPPSVVGGNAYRVAEYRSRTGQSVDWAAIHDYLDPPRPPRAMRQNRPGQAEGFAGLVRYLESRPARDRNGPLYWACRRALEEGADDSVLDQLRDAIIRAGHNPVDAQKTIESARRAGAPQ